MVLFFLALALILWPYDLVREEVSQFYFWSDEKMKEFGAENIY